MFRFSMVRGFLLPSILAMVALMPAAAQDEGGGPMGDLSELDGIVAAVNRSYVVDMGPFTFGTPEGGQASPVAERVGPIYLSLGVMEFEDAELAAGAFEVMREEVGPSFTEGEDGAGAEVVEGELAGIGEQAWRIDIADTDGYFYVAFAQDGEYVMMVVATGRSAEAFATTASFLAYLVEEGEASADAEAFMAEGGSTGGLWGFFPDDDNEALAGMMQYGDEIVFPVPDPGV
jgi:hypothetical protein